MKSKNILFVIDSLRPGGAERQLIELIKGLDKQRFNIHLCVLKYVDTGYADIALQQGIEINYFEKKSKYDLITTFLKLTRYIISNNIDVVHSFLNFGSLVGCTASFITRRYTVCSAIRGAKDLNYKYMLSTRYLSYISDVFISNSKAGFNNRFKKQPNHFKVIYNGINFDRFESSIYTNDLKVEFNVLKNDNVIGMIGSLLNYKDHVTLLHAMSNVLKVYPHSKLLIIGDGPEKENLQSLCKSLSIESNVIFTGFRSDVESIYRILNVTVMLTDSSIKQEGTSNAILESMAVGVPVVASEGGGTGEIIDDGISGYIVTVKSVLDTTEKILLLLNDTETSGTIAKVAKQRVKSQFSMEKYIDEHTNIYLKC